MLKLTRRVALLNYNQYQSFQDSGLIPEYYMDDRQLPAYAVEKFKRNFGTTQEFKLFPKDVSKDDLLYLYERCGIATNIVDIIPQKVWGKGFTVKVTDEEGDEVTESPLEKEIWSLNKTYDVMKHFEEAHRSARLYGLGIIVVGLSDGHKLEEEVTSPVSQVSYLTTFSGKEITDIEFETNVNSDKFGQIKRYKVKIKGIDEDFWIHADRVIHIIERTVERSPWGKSQLENAYDLLLVLKNSLWSAGEAYYQNASPLFVLSWEDQEGTVEPPTATEIDDAKDDLEDLHVRKRFIKPKSWELEVVKGSGKVADPEKIFNPILNMIGAAAKIPKQLLLGTEAGALASGEVNLQQWYDQIAEIQTQFAEPLLLEFYSKLQEWHVLPEGDFDVEWLPLGEMDEKERAEIDKLKIEAARKALGNLVKGDEPFMTVEEVRVMLGLKPEMGEGRRSTMKTEASDITSYTGKLEREARSLSSTLNGLLTQTLKNKLTEDEAVSKAAEIISFEVDSARSHALTHLRKRLGDNLKKLSPEQHGFFDKLEKEYLYDFKKILQAGLERGD